MSETYTWATLDNADAIVLDTSNNNYCIVGTESGIKQRLMKAAVNEEIVTFDSYAVDGIIDNSETTGNYKMIKAGFFGYTTGILNSVTLHLSDLTSQNNGTVNRVVLGIIESTKVTVKAWATLTATDTAAKTKTFAIIAEHNGYLNITNSLIDDPKNGLMILPIAAEFESEPIFTIGSTGSDTTYMDKGVMLSLKRLNSRSIFDAGTHLYQTSQKGSDTIPKYTAEIFSNIITDHIKDNYNNYHVSPSVLLGLNSLKYYAPILKIKNESNKENIVFSRCYISHDSLSLGGEINLIGKKLESIQIPINTGDSWAAGHKIQVTDYIGQNNFEVSIAFSETEPSADSALWISADYTLAQKLADGHEITWELTFAKTAPVYSNPTGIWIKVKNINKLNDNTKQQIFCRTYRDYVNGTDKMHLHSATNTNDATTFNRTPDIRIVFDFDGRLQFMEMLYRKISALS